MAPSDYDRGRMRRGEVRETVQKRGGFRSDEYYEDEEDYEEFARMMDKKRGRTGGASAAGKTPGRTSDRNGMRSSRQGSRAYREAGDLTDEAYGYEENDYDGRGGRKQTSRNQKGIRVSTYGVSEENGGSGGRNKTPQRKKRSFFRTFLIFLLVLFLAAVGVGGFFFYRISRTLRLQNVNSVDLEEQFKQGISDQVRLNERMNGYKNIAFFGVDSRAGDLLDGDNRSDTIMICSIHEKTGQIKLVSVFRDTLLDVGGGDYRKANAAYAMGGPAQAVTMLNKNLDLNIVDFVTVGFEGLAKTIDALGGIELEIDEEERGYTNQYLHDMHIELGTDDTPVEETGLVRVTGIQATAYSRIRYTAGDDFRRAERQRIVLNKTFEKAKSASPAILVKVADNVMGDMATSLSSSELLELIIKAGSLDLAGTGGLPLEEYRSFGSSYEEGEYVLPYDLEDNVRWLHEFLFDEKDYSLSEEAMERNEGIKNYASGGWY